MNTQHSKHRGGFPTRITRSRRGITIVETLATGACVVVLIAGLSTAANHARPINGDAISMANLIEIGTGHALYAADWGGLQWCGHQSNFGQATNCATYLNTIACPPQQILGWDTTGGLWSYWLGGGLCGSNFPGNCGNWVVYIPNEFATTNGVFGAYRLMQVRSFHDYVDGRFYDEVFYAPNDIRTYAAASRNFNSPSEFNLPPNSPVFSSYAMSPAAMWNPEVMRAPSRGGFRAPSSFPESYERQSLWNAAYPELKSFVFEVNWCQSPPASGQAFGSTSTPYRYNQGAASRPITLFYDGHVWYLNNKRAIKDDASQLAQGVDGLWSRDTPLGTSGYYADTSVDGSRTNHSMLTTDGILGRDVLEAP